MANQEILRRDPRVLSVPDLQQLSDMNHSSSESTLLNINMDFERLKGSISSKCGPRIRYDSQGDKVGLSLSTCESDSVRSSPEASCQDLVSLDFLPSSSQKQCCKPNDVVLTEKDIPDLEIAIYQTTPTKMIDEEVANVMGNVIDKIVFIAEGERKDCEKKKLKNALGPSRELNVGKQLMKLSNKLLGKAMSEMIKTLLNGSPQVISKTNVEVPIRKEDTVSTPPFEKLSTSCYDDELSHLPKLSITIPKSSYITPICTSDQSPMHRVVSADSLHDCYNNEGKQIGIDCDGYASSKNPHSCVSFPRHSPRGFTPRAPGSSTIQEST